MNHTESQQQKWTVETATFLAAHGGLPAIVAAHNAELSTERQRNRRTFEGSLPTDTTYETEQGETPQPQRSEQQWTEETVTKVWNESEGDFFRLLSQKHNAALAAERRQADEQREVTLKLNSELVQQLLSAQAAIEKLTGDLAERLAHDCDFHAIDGSKWWKTVKAARKLDLSLLHQHDAEIATAQWKSGFEIGVKQANEKAAEVRKPLVDALEQLRKRVLTKEQMAIVADALAEVKERK